MGNPTDSVNSNKESHEHRDYGSTVSDSDDDCHSSNDVELQLQHHPVLPLEVTNNSEAEATAREDDSMLHSTAPEQKPLTRREIFNLAFCVLAWACTIANVTLVVGTSNVVILSIGGDSSLSSVPLATFFLGAALVSLTVTPWHFQSFGRKLGFLTGVGLGLVGTALGCFAVAIKSPPVLLVATTAFGAAMGIGFYLRFAAVELVPQPWADKAVTLVVAGGCIAAFAGPESAEGTRGIFGDDYMYMGVFVMTGVFNVANAVFTSLVQFPHQQKPKVSTSTTTEHQSTPSLGTIQQESPPSENDNDKEEHWFRVVSILQTRNFIMPMLIAALSWIIMALPMSVLRVAMHNLGYTSRQSLLTIELHFLGMYAPGFFSGQWIARCGPRFVAMAAVSVFLVAFALLQFAEEASIDDDERQWNLTVWILGMLLIGGGWNCAFSASTVGSTRSYTSRPDCKSFIQAANDGLTFLLAGAVIFSASYIYQAGGEGLQGWRLVNWVVLGFIGVLASILGTDAWMDRRQSSSRVTGTTRASRAVDLWSSPTIKI